MSPTLAEAIKRADMDSIDRLSPSPEEVSALPDAVTLFRSGLQACIDQYQGAGKAKAQRLVTFADHCSVDFGLEEQLRRGQIGWILRSSS